MKDLDYSPALNEQGTEFDIVKAAEIAKSYHGLRVIADAALTDFIYAQGSDFDEAEFPGMAVLRAALASSPTTAGLDESDAADDEAANQWQAMYPNVSYAARVAVRLWNRLIVAEGAATRPAEDTANPRLIEPKLAAPAGLDVERLAEALSVVTRETLYPGDKGYARWLSATAAMLAAEYDRLSRAATRPAEDET